MDFKKKLQDEILHFLPSWIADYLRELPKEKLENLMEIRLRANCPPILRLAGKNMFLTKKHGIIPILRETKDILTTNELWSIFTQISSYSFHSYEHQIKEGFITIKGGHRIGIAGDFVESREDFGVRNITSLNIRIAREVIGAGDKLLHIFSDGKQKGLLIISPPNCGKTTIIRDLARSISSGRCGYCLNVALVDERGELSGYSGGYINFDLGLSTDLVLGVPKAKAILQCLRTLSPDVIICDEAGSSQEIKAISEGLGAGVSFITTGHGYSVEDLYIRPTLKSLLDTNVFTHIALLECGEKAGKIKLIKEVSILEQCISNKPILNGALDWYTEEPQPTKSQQILKEDHTRPYIAF